MVSVTDSFIFCCVDLVESGVISSLASAETSQYRMDWLNGRWREGNELELKSLRPMSDMIADVVGMDWAWIIRLVLVLKFVRCQLRFRCCS